MAVTDNLYFLQVFEFHVIFVFVFLWQYALVQRSKSRRPEEPKSQPKGSSSLRPFWPLVLLPLGRLDNGKPHHFFVIFYVTSSSAAGGIGYSSSWMIGEIKGKSGKRKFVNFWAEDVRRQVCVRGVVGDASGGHQSESFPVECCPSLMSSSSPIPHICHLHHPQCSCQNFQAGVK